MSSLHQDRLLVEGPDAPIGPASTLAKARGTSRRPAEESATGTVPTQRQGTAQRSGSIQSTTRSAPVARTRRTAGAKAAAVASGAAGTVASRARAATNATAKVASGKAATVSAATAKAATAKVTAAKAARTKTAAAKAATAKAATAKVKAPTAGKAAAPVEVAKAAPAAKAAPVAKPAAAKAAPAAKPTAAKAAPVAETVAKTAPVAKASSGAKAAPDATAAPAATAMAVEAVPATVRPTPHKRTAPQADVVPAAVEPLPAVDVAVETPAVVAEGRRTGFLRRRPPSVGRRPALYLAAALIGAMSLSTVTTAEPTAQATETMSHSVSVAQELGIQAAPAQAITDTAASELLGDLAVSRNARDAEQAAAATIQAEADRVAAEAAAAAAAEAARPKAVLPVQGARLTSGFGARWGTLHAGIDLAAPMQTPEYAAVDGVVLEAGPASGYGLVVYIQHDNGDVTVYGHMDSILVEPGQVVRAGDTIALLGNRGQSTGPHLHFEVHVGGLNGQKIDPLPWLRERGVAI